MRLVSVPDSGSTSFNVKDFYLNDNVKLTGKSLTVFPISLDGYCISYFPNGKRKAINHYTTNVLTGSQTFQYPNSKVYKVVKYNESNEPGYAYDDNLSQLVTAFDSTGNPTVTNGNGYYKGYDDDFVYITEEGPVKNGKKDGEWKGEDRKLHLVFKETYANDILQNGTSTHETGLVVNYTTARNKVPNFKGGKENFGKFLSNTLRYPEKASRAKMQGKVILGFIVETNGQITGITVMQSAGKALDDEAIRVLTLSPLWEPATNYGISVRMFYTLPIVFHLADK